MSAGQKVTRLARAKINLTLHVTGVRSDGYHLLDSLVCFADFGDTVIVQPSDRPEFEVVGPMAIGVPTNSSNLVLKAAALLNGPPSRIVLHKCLPAAAGIGGGSADAAATLQALSEMTGLPIPEGIETLGADVPVCLNDRAVRMQGVGEIITSIDPLPKCPAVLVNPRIDVPTPAVFAAIKVKENPKMGDIPSFETVAELAQWLVAQRNDLLGPASHHAPVIHEVLNELGTGLYAGMSGSGATCFALCPTIERANSMADHIAQKSPNWWVQSTTLQ